MRLNDVLTVFWEGRGQELELQPNGTMSTVTSLRNIEVEDSTGIKGFASTKIYIVLRSTRTKQKKIQVINELKIGILVEVTFNRKGISEERYDYSYQ